MKENDKWKTLLMAFILLIAICLIICNSERVIMLGTIILVVILFNWDKIKQYRYKKSDQYKRDQINKQYQSIAYGLFPILQENATLLEIISPKSISDILPPNRDSLQSINGIPFLRYVVLKESNADLNYNNIRLLLRSKLMQALNCNMISNLPNNSYNKCPTIYPYQVSSYPRDSNYIAIDIMYVDNDKTYNFLKEHERNLTRYTRQKAPMKPMNDKDF